MKRKFFLAQPDTDLKNIPTTYDHDITEDEAKKKLKKTRKAISAIQDKMYAYDKYSVLICFQGMDTSGKDSMIREVFKGFNARGVVVNSFKTPSEKELDHDYMWRHYVALPEKGKFTIFNRSHYENVLITKVHPEYILNEKLPQIQTVDDITDAFWEERYKTFNTFETHWAKNGVIVLKFFLHLSKEEQRKRLLRRLEKEKHNWKFSPGDLEERKSWSLYSECYENILQKTSTPEAPWYIIPSDSKKIARYLVAEIILETLQEYKDISYPELDEKIQSRISLYKKQLLSEL